MLFRYRMPGEVRALYQKYAQHPEAARIIGMLDAEVIYSQIRRHRPGHCIELGCGLGTVAALVAMAMNANKYGKITSLEQLDWMTTLAWDMLPEPCKKRVEIIRCDAEIREYFGEQWSCYRFKPPEADVDFVIVDGPDVKDAHGAWNPYPDGDLIELLPYLKAGCRVFVDARRSTVAAYRRHLGSHFKIRQSRLGGYTLMKLVKPVT